MKILIIGGTGQISTAITAQLLARGDAVPLYTRGKSPIRFSGAATQVVGDRTDYPRFEAQMREVGPFDCVIDMVGYEAEDAAAAVRSFRGRIDHHLFCSTTDLYAKPASRYPIREDEPRRPITEYAARKVRAKIYCSMHTGAVISRPPSSALLTLMARARAT